MLRELTRAVRDGQRLVRQAERLAAEVRRLLDVEPQRQAQPAQERRRGHGPHCRHCQLVEAYRLERDTQVRYGESLACGDEDYRPVTFKAWLTENGREQRTIRDEEWAAEWS
jgi:hypothetical protein